MLADIALQAQPSITARPGGHLSGLSLSSWAGRTVLNTKGFLLTRETWISLKVFSFYLCSHRQNLSCEVFLLSYVHKGSSRPPECPGLARELGRGFCSGGRLLFMATGYLSHSCLEGKRGLPRECGVHRASNMHADRAGSAGWPPARVSSVRRV